MKVYFQCFKTSKINLMHLFHCFNVIHLNHLSTDLIRHRYYGISVISTNLALDKDASCAKE